jgi:hypothetical protein
MIRLDIAHIISMLSVSSVVSAWRELGLRVEGTAMLAADMLNKQLRTAKKGWLSSLGWA